MFWLNFQSKKIKDKDIVKINYPRRKNKKIKPFRKTIDIIYEDKD